MTHAYAQRQWEITEHKLPRETMPHAETMFTIGNGYLGVRGTFEEGFPAQETATLVAGIFNQRDAESVAELVNMPNGLHLTIRYNGETVRLEAGRVLGYERVLDMKTALLRRSVLWLSPKGQLLRLTFERFASLHNQHVLALQVQLQPLSEGTHIFEVVSALDGRVTNPSQVDHWATLAGDVQGDTLTVIGTTTAQKYQVGMASRLTLEGVTATQTHDTSDARLPRITYHFDAPQNQVVTLTKLVTLHTTRDSEEPLATALMTLALAQSYGYNTLKQTHISEWASEWSACDIQIDGDEVAQQSVRFCMYHILIATPRVDEYVSIGAKTLSGFGYKGHVFWDTELFILPPLTLMNPDLSRRMLMYRYHTLAGARKKAHDSGYEGAMFPWESADTGEETTPRWTNPHPVTGEQARIWTGDHEQHISSDIAFGVLHFWRNTGDDRWFADYGAEIVLDTAKFWGSRVEYNADQDRYELRQQIGPDEYHENIDNAVFTNRMVAWHLGQALQVLDWLKGLHVSDYTRLVTALDLTDARLAHWRTVSQKMFIPTSELGGGILEQFEGFFERLAPLNVEDYTPRTMSMDWIMGYAKTQRTRVIKQADVVMLIALFGNELGDDAFLQRNWAMYYPLCDHGSSLSPSIHAWVASRLGYIEEAYDLFLHAATLDLHDRKGNTHEGIHAACCGGVLQAVIYGFCGLTVRDGIVKVKPALPAHWRKVSFNINYQGKHYPIEVINQGIGH